MDFKLQTYIKRTKEEEILASLKQNPVTAVIGPRQCGKSTVLKRLSPHWPPNGLSILTWRETPTGPARGSELFLTGNRGRLVCIDEIQRKPDLFPLLRSLVDETGKPGQFLLSGSASPELLRQSSESLAGRIHYVELTPFTSAEVPAKDLWIRGGFPRSYLADSQESSFAWREDFIRTYLERDIPQLGISIPAVQLRRFWTMCAHSSGQILNRSKVGESLGISHVTVQRYLDIMTGTFMLRILPPFFVNTKKRLVRSPKVFFRDTGILHAILGIPDMNDLMGHPVFGASWETFCVENILSAVAGWEASFFRTSDGTEIDLVLRKGNRLLAVECKASSSPRVSKALPRLLDELRIERCWIAAPVEEGYDLGERIGVASLPEVMAGISALTRR
jgi:predicted AAA+ superfamily ATPase